MQKLLKISDKNVSVLKCTFANKMSFVGQLKDFYDDDKIMEYEYDNPNNLSYKDIKYIITIEDKLLMPKFRFKRNISFNIPAEDVLLSLYEITELRGKIDRWYVYQLIDILFSAERVESIEHAIKSLKLLLNKEYDREYKEKLLTRDCFKEYPDIEIFFNACYGDYYLQNNYIEYNVDQVVDKNDLDIHSVHSRIKYTNNFLISFDLPQIIIDYIEFDPFNNEIEVDFSFLEILFSLVSEEKDDFVCQWPQYETVEDYILAYRYRNDDRMPMLEYKIGTPVKLEKTFKQFIDVLNSDSVRPFTLTRALKRYITYINRQNRFLLIGNLSDDITTLVFHNAD